MKKTDTNENNVHFDAFFDSASIGILITNKSGQIISANPFLLKLFGYEKEELAYQKIDLLIPKRFHQNHKSHVEGFVQKPIGRPMGTGMDLYGIKKNKEEFPVEISLSNYIFEKEEYLVAFVSDATEKKIVTKKLMDDNEKILAINNNFSNQVNTHFKELEFINKKLEDVLSYQNAIFNNGIFLFQQHPTLPLKPLHREVYRCKDNLIKMVALTPKCVSIRGC